MTGHRQVCWLQTLMDSVVRPSVPTPVLSFPTAGSGREASM